MPKKINEFRLSGLKIGASMPMLVHIDRHVALELFEHIDALDMDIDRLQGNVVQLQGELKAEREAKKVVLPREAVDEIELYHGDSFKVLKAVFHGEDTVQHLRHRVPLDILLSALVNDFMIEEPPTTEDKIVTSLKQALEDMNVECPVPVERLAKVLTHAVREVLAEDRQEE